MLINHTDAASIPVASPQIQKDGILSTGHVVHTHSLARSSLVHEVPSFDLCHKPIILYGQ